MTGHTHSLAEWAAMVGIAASGYASFSCFYFLLVDADPSDFDPRPAVRRVLESPAADRLLVEATNARYALRDAAVWLAALLMLLSAPPKGATR